MHRRFSQDIEALLKRLATHEVNAATDTQAGDAGEADAALGTCVQGNVGSPVVSSPFPSGKATVDPLRLQDILEETSERGFSIVIFLLALPFLLPVPPGMPGIIAPALLLLSGQMALGKHKPWLPRRIARFRFPRTVIAQLLKNLNRITKIFERITRPRLKFVANNPYIWRINGLAIAWLTILLVLPIPGTNFLPTIGILLLSVATLEADGVLMCIAYLWSFFVTSFFGFIGYTLLQTSNLIFN